MSADPSTCSEIKQVVVVMSSISRSTVDRNSATFQPQRSSSGTNSCVPDEDLCGRNVVLLRSTALPEMLDITTDI